MSGANVTVTSTKGMSTLVRPKFEPGMLLHHEDLEQLSSYARELNRLMFRSLLGCGVICGLVVKPPESKCGKIQTTVGMGLALDCSGDPVYVPKDQVIAIDDHCDPNLPNRLWVVLCGTVKCCAPRPSVCSDDEDEKSSVCTRERAGFEIRVVRKRPECACGCKEPEDLTDDEKIPFVTRCKCVNPELECYAEHYAGKCGCTCDDCSDCSCDCILLARLDNTGTAEVPKWTVDHRVRRFIRPVLMRDPQVAIEEDERKHPKDKEQEAFGVAKGDTSAKTKNALRKQGTHAQTDI